MSDEERTAEPGQGPGAGAPEAAAGDAPPGAPGAEALAGAVEAAARADAPPRPPGGPQLRFPENKGGLAAAETRITELEGQLAEANRQLQRLAADFENFRRRAASEKDELVRFAASRVLENFLPIVDNFERALAHLATADPAVLRHGVELIYRQVADFLARQGVAAMEAVGAAFDPNLHEAIGKVESTDHPDNTVLNEVQKGYVLNGRVLRHAMVQVSSNPEALAEPVAKIADPAPEAADPAPEAADSAPEAAGAQGQPAEAPAFAAATNDEHDFTLEDLMAEAQSPEGSKEESHG